MKSRVPILEAKKRNLVFLLIFGLVFSLAKPAFTQQVTTQDEFRKELMSAYYSNDSSLVDSLIRYNRFLVKPFVNETISECIQSDLKGELKRSRQLKEIATKSSLVFEKTFGEKSLSVGVNYLTIWNKEQKRTKLTADSLFDLGTRFRISGQMEEALGCLQPALKKYEEIHDNRGVAEILGSYGAIYYNPVDYPEALKYYQAALIKREEVDDKALIGNTLSSIGSIYYDYYKDNRQALIFLTRAEEVRAEIGDQVNLGRTIHVKAAVLQQSGQLERALNYFQKSYDLNLKSGDKVRMAQAKMHSGEILNSQGKYPEAIDQLGKSLDIYKELKLSSEMGDVISQIGFVYSNIGDLNKAVEMINEAAEIKKETNDTKGLAGVYNHLGIVLMEAGRFEKALEFYNLSLNIYNKLDDKTLLLPLFSNIGTVYLDLKDYVKAEEFHKRGLKLSQENNETIDEVHFLLNLANDQIMLGKLEEAKTNYDFAGEIAKSLNNPDLTWRILVGTAEYHEQKGEYDKAISLNDSSLKILEGLRGTLQTKEQKASFVASERYVFEDIIDLLQTLHEKDNKKGYDKLAFQYAERSKSRVLLDLLSEPKLLSSIQPNTLKSSYTETVSLEEAGTICPDKNSVLLEYFVGDSSSCLWVITKSSHMLFRIPGAKILQEQIETIRFGLINPNQQISEFFINAGNALYKELIKPAESYLSDKSRLLIIPDGVINYLPFEVLLTESKRHKVQYTYSNLPFLVKKYPISYGQSASVIKMLVSQQKNVKNKEDGEKSLIAFGDPVYEDSIGFRYMKFPRIEYTSAEVSNIAKYFRKGASKLYMRENATEENVKKENELLKYNYVHFATHGFIDENNPDQSALVLCELRNSANDGFLRASEVFNLRLNANLVVLSACQTGLGKLVRGEGMIGLTRAFMYAGTPSVLVSLWSVSDISTAYLMGNFYRNLIKNKHSKTEALREAQLDLISNKVYSHPFYWAPFILIGDWR